MGKICSAVSWEFVTNRLENTIRSFLDFPVRRTRKSKIKPATLINEQSVVIKKNDLKDWALS